MKNNQGVSRRKFVYGMGIGLGAFCLPAKAQHRIISISNGFGTPTKRDYGLAELCHNELKVMDTLIDLYGSADLSDLISYIKMTPNGSPNNIVPILSLGHVYLNRYIQTQSRDDLVRTLDFFETAADPQVYGDAPLSVGASGRVSLSWGETWASSPTAAYLAMGVVRLRIIHLADEALKARIEALDLRVEIVVGIEADLHCTDAYPYQPYVSGTAVDGDSKSEENAWEAMNLAWASQTYPSHPHAKIWEDKARQLAQYSIVRERDNLFFKGSQIVTVLDDYQVWNHGEKGDPWYNNPILLRMGALAFRMNGNPVPSEFDFNVAPLYGTYKSFCVKVGEDWQWNRPSDPVGNPTIFPVPGMNDDVFVQDIAKRKAESEERILWIRTLPVVGKLTVDPEKGLVPESSLGVAIQNSKVVWYYLTDWLWRFQPAVSH